MQPLILLAEASSSGLTLSDLFGLMGGSTVITTLGVLVARGYWAKTVTPLIEAEIRKWYAAQEQTEARAKERLASFREWYDRREQVDEREKEMQHVLRTPTVVAETTQAMKLVIDNEIKRSDVKVLFQSRLLAITGEGEVEKARIHDLDEDDEYELFVDAVVLLDMTGKKTEDGN